jgi:hypothetical protein
MPRVRARAGAAIVGIVTIGYFALLLSNTCYFAAGPDSSGYLNEARLLLSGRISATVDTLAEAKLDPSLIYLFTPYGFVRGTTPGTMVPTYPVGTSLHLAAGAAGGWRVAPFVVVPIAAMACLFLIVYIARRLGVTTGWSIVAAMLLAAFPMFIAQSVQPVSDILATFWALAVIACALRSHEHWHWAVLCGIAFAIGVAVRPTNILIAIPLLIAMRFHLRQLAIAIAAAVPFAVALIWYYDALYGSPLMTGYGGVGGILSFTAFPTCFSKQLLWLIGMATPLVLGGLFVPAHRALLLSWFGVFFLFYTYYSFCPDHSSVRFLLPALPPLIIGFVSVLSRIPRTVAVVLVLIVLGREVQQVGRLHVLHLNEWEAIYPQTVAWVDREVPRDAVVMSAITSGAFYFHSDRPIVRWDQLTPETSVLLRANAHFARPWYAVVSEVEGGLAGLRTRAPGEWREVGKIRDVTVWRLE